MEAWAALAERFYQDVGPWTFVLAALGAVGLWSGGKVALWLVRRMIDRDTEHAKQIADLIAAHSRDKEQMILEHNSRIAACKDAAQKQVDAIHERLDETIENFLDRDNQKREDARTAFAKIDAIFEQTLTALRDHTNALHQVALSVSAMSGNGVRRR